MTTDLLRGIALVLVAVGGLISAVNIRITNKRIEKMEAQIAWIKFKLDALSRGKRNDLPIYERVNNN